MNAPTEERRQEMQAEIREFEDHFRDPNKWDSILSERDNDALVEFTCALGTFLVSSFKKTAPKKHYLRLLKKVLQILEFRGVIPERQENAPELLHSLLSGRTEAEQITLIRDIGRMIRDNTHPHMTTTHHLLFMRRVLEYTNLSDSTNIH